jgi:hypothetical protein
MWNDKPIVFCKGERYRAKFAKQQEELLASAHRAQDMAVFPTLQFTLRY